MSTSRAPANSFGRALRFARTQQGLPQEHLDIVSSRTYVSVLERNRKSPTLSKVDDLAAALGLHPLVLLALAYADPAKPAQVDVLLGQVARDIATLLNGQAE